MLPVPRITLASELKIHTMIAAEKTTLEYVNAAASEPSRPLSAR